MQPAAQRDLIDSCRRTRHHRRLHKARSHAGMEPRRNPRLADTGAQVFH